MNLINKPILKTPSVFDIESLENWFPSTWVNQVLNEFDQQLDSTYPKVNISESEEQMTIDATVPGLTQDQVKVEYDNGILRISGEKQEKRKSYSRHEIFQKKFSRSFSVPHDYFDVDNIDCKMLNGILTVTVPKTQQKNESKILKIN